ncbi:hypothetical protein [Methylobacterium nigriterrae]|uniref:hypothetical protein n=1 Tax=Methylobacterium nigriterrae TaxID=3127512 RepID=UPI0030137A64
MGAALATGRRSGRRGALARLALALALSTAIRPAEAARLVSARGSQAESYGRLVLAFDKSVPVRAKVSGTVLVLSYGERTAAAPERIAAEMPAYVSTVRRDPDGTGLRLALQKPYRVNVQEAGEQVFVDLLPEGWSGLPPPLPPEVVADLARRAQRAEAALKATAPPPAPRPLAIEVAHLPTVTRLSLRLPTGLQAGIERAGAATRISVPGAWRIDVSDTRGRIKPAVSGLTVESDDTAANLLITPGDGYAVTAERDEDALTIDVAPTGPIRTGETAPGVKGDADARAALQALVQEAEAEAPKAPAEPHPAAAQAPGTPRPKVADKAADAAPSPAAAPKRAARPAGDGLVFSFARPVPVALFERAGLATLVFETSEAVTLPVGRPAGFEIVSGPRRSGGVVTLQIAVPPAKLLDLLPVGDPDAPGGWELAAGDALSESESLVATRLPAQSGRVGLAVKLPDPVSATWLDLDGERVAVVTTLARRPAGIAKRQRFVDFELLPSRLGVAVLAQADDLVVRPDLDGVTIAREGGLAVSAVARQPEVAVGEIGELAIQRGPWEVARRGNVRDTLRGQIEAAAAVSGSLRGPPRLALARAYLANGFTTEAIAVLEAASYDDPLVAAQRDVGILLGAAQALTGRAEEARHTLGAEALARDPEAGLWRGYAEALAGRWLAAESAFRGTLGILDRYPDDLQARLRVAVAETALEAGDLETATRQIGAAAGRAPDALTRDGLALLRGRIEEAAGQGVAAIASYERLEREAVQPVAAEAAYRAAMLAHGSGKLDAAGTIDRLERLAVMWHGGDTENGIVAGLARLYREAGRWRDAFMTTRRATATAPDAPVSRALFAEAQSLFDELFLTERGDKLSGIEAVSLYFDFKEFAPIGRRGDEIVRRLADRLVELDLLDSASDLLQYQVDNRLTGPARAGVAARLAAIRLMDGKPLKALEVLDATYLPELPGELRRARALIRARALSDLSRTDLALETIDGETGPDAQRLRADILWGSRRWREAGEAHETLLGDAWRGRQPLDDAARADVIRAAIAYDLSGETLGLERLKGKFAGPMAESADARTFALLTGPNALRAPGFREIAQRATSAETLAAFLAEYRKRYPDTAVPDRGKAEKAAENRPEGAPATPPG